MDIQRQIADAVELYNSANKVPMKELDIELLLKDNCLMSFKPDTKECVYSGHNLDLKNLTVEDLLANISCSKHGSVIKYEQDKKSAKEANTGKDNFKIYFFVIELIAVILLFIVIYKKRKFAVSEEEINLN